MRAVCFNRTMELQKPTPLWDNIAWQLDTITYLKERRLKVRKTEKESETETKKS